MPPWGQDNHRAKELVLTMGQVAKTATWPDIAEGEVSMSIGLIALLDDIAAIAKVAAASLGDAASHAAKIGGAVHSYQIARLGTRTPLTWSSGLASI